MKFTKRFLHVATIAILLFSVSLFGCSAPPQEDSSLEVCSTPTYPGISSNSNALVFCGTYKINNVPTNDCIEVVSYYYEPTTKVMYLALNDSRDKVSPIPKSDGEYLTYEEWVKSFDESKS